MRTIQMIDAELRALAAYRAACTQAGKPVTSTTAADQLLDERNRALQCRPTPRAIASSAFTQRR